MINITLTGHELANKLLDYAKLGLCNFENKSEFDDFMSGSDYESYRLSYDSIAKAISERPVANVYSYNSDMPSEAHTEIEGKKLFNGVKLFEYNFDEALLFDDINAKYENAGAYVFDELWLTPNGKLIMTYTVLTLLPAYGFYIEHRDKLPVKTGSFNECESFTEFLDDIYTYLTCGGDIAEYSSISDND